MKTLKYFLLFALFSACGNESYNGLGPSDVDTKALVYSIDNGKTQIELKGLIKNGSTKKGSSRNGIMSVYQFDVKPTADVAIKLETDYDYAGYCIYKVIGRGMDFNYVSGSCNEVDGGGSDFKYKATDTIKLEEATYFLVLERMEGNYNIKVAW